MDNITISACVNGFRVDSGYYDTYVFPTWDEVLTFIQTKPLSFKKTQVEAEAEFEAQEAAKATPVAEVATTPSA